MKDCPCGSHFAYTDCCGPLIRGAIFADTAEDLMRSRYTATVLGETAYLRDTLLPEERPEGGSAKEAASRIRFKRLEILGSKNGERGDVEGEVRFQAVYDDGEGEKTLSETSRFIHQDGRWYYSDKKSRVQTTAAKAKGPVVRSGPKVGRNDPCPCGSGKKFKKCCGK